MLVALLILQAVRGGGIVAPAQTVTAAVYCYEQSKGSVPPPVLAGIDKLNRAGIMATTFDVTTTDGTGETPEQYKVPLATANETGIPVFVVMASNAVVRTVKSPTTAAEIEGAVK
mgnify:CR=1 FL=1